MLRYTEADGSLIFTVRVAPRASKSAVAGERDGALKVRVAAPPVDGAANEELVKTLAKALSVPTRAVEIVSGHSSKTKTMRVSGVELRQILHLAGVK